MLRGVVQVPGGGRPKKSAKEGRVEQSVIWGVPYRGEAPSSDVEGGLLLHLSFIEEKIIQ